MFLYLRWLTREPKEKTGGLSESSGAPATGAARKLIGLDLGILKSGAQKTAVIGDQMTRRCKHSECRSELLPASKCSDIIQKRGFCSVECLAAHGREKAKQRREKERKEYVRQGRERLKTRSDYAKEAQQAVNAYVRLRDMGKPCVSCDKPDDGTHQRHASHYRSVGACSALRFNLKNIYASCQQCNTAKSGNIIEYRLRLKQRYGEELVDWLESQNGEARYTKEYLKRLKKVFLKRVRLKKKRYNIT